MEDTTDGDFSVESEFAVTATLVACFLKVPEVGREVWMIGGTACACASADPAELEAAKAFNETNGLFWVSRGFFAYSLEKDLWSF